MTKIVVYSKDHLIPLQNTENNQILLNQNTVVLMHFPKENIASIERSGTTAIVHLKNGETVVLENFFNLDGTPANVIVLTNPQGYYDVMLLDEQGQLIHYNPINIFINYRQLQIGSVRHKSMQYRRVLKVQRLGMPQNLLKRDWRFSELKLFT